MGKGIVRISGTVAGGSEASAAPTFAVLLTEAGPRTLKLSDQTTYTTLRAVIQEPVTPAGGLLLGTVLTLQLSSDNGVTWGTLGTYTPDRTDKDGTNTYYQTTIAIPNILVNTVTVNYKARAWSANQYVDGGPATAATSVTCAVSPIGIPSTTGATIGISTVTPKTDPSSGWQWWEQTITIQTPGGADPNCWAYQVTVQECNASGVGNPGDSNGVERPWFDFANDGTSVTKTIQGSYVPEGSPYTYTKYKVYGFSRTATVNTPSNCWQDPTYSVLEQWPGGATNSLQNFGPLPAGAIPGSRITDGSITASQIGSVSATTITGSITATQITSITAAQITGSITASQIGSVNATTITGSILATQIGSVNASAISGAIAATQIGSVNASAITGTITATQIASVNATSITGSISASQIGSVNAAAISGSITASQIASVNASAISGTITAAQIASITAGQITGSIIATTISGTITASQITGSITAAQIGSVNATVISGQLAASQIAAVNATAITGGIAASQITAVNASAITGTITATQIASVNASAVQGTISASQIATVNAGSIQGSIAAGQIGSVAATTITGVIVTSQLADQILDTVSKFSTGIFGTNIVNNGTTIGLGTTDTSNMAPNPDFEYDFKDWSISAGVTISTAKKYTGAKAAKLVGANCSVVNAALFTCKPGDQFVLQSYVYAETGAAGYVNALVRFLDAAGAMISDGPWGTAYASGAIGVWQACQTGISVAPAGATQVQIYAIWSGAASGTWYLDNVVLTRAVDQSRISSVAATSITGSITAGQIGSVNASALTGLIIAAQISSITAAQITGAITASSLSGNINSNQISGTITVSQLAGGITADKISTVYATSISGSIAAGQIASLAASQISGQITAGQIASVYATVISGSILASQINSVNAGSISGTLAWNQIGSINANTITVNQITAGQIGSVNAGSILAGTITASISINSPTISGGSISGTSISIATSGGTVAINGTTYGVSVTATSSSVSGFRTSFLDSYNSRTYLSVIAPYFMSTTDGTYTGTLNPSYVGFSGGGYSTTYGNGGVSVYYGGYASTLSYSSLSVGNITCITSGQFVGAGVNCPSYGVACAGVNPYVGGVQYYGASFTFYDQGGALHTVKGGVLVS